MQIKDYFALLELEASASVTDIKKAYRRLALQLHPDKAGNDPYAAARFTEIKEAYEVLTDPGKRDYYLQQRWYNQAAGIRRTEQTVTPATMILQALELERHVARLDEFRMDREGLKVYILDLLSDERLEKLKAFNDKESMQTFVRSVIRSSRHLETPQATAVVAQLRKAFGEDPLLENETADFLHHSRKKKNREKYTVILVLLLTLLLCLLIFFTGR
jgi:curved DNA-binding protein CbpA